MLPIIIPTETLAGALELVCYFFTAVGAVISFLLTARG